jgi:hypothetical protein
MLFGLLCRVLLPYLWHLLGTQGHALSTAACRDLLCYMLYADVKSPMSACMSELGIFQGHNHVLYLVNTVLLLSEACLRVA